MAPEEEEEEEAQLLPQGREAEGSEGQSRLATCADQARGPALSHSNLCASRAGMVLSKIAHSGRGASGKSLPSQKLKRGYSSPAGGWNRIHWSAAQIHGLYSLVLEAGALGAGVAQSGEGLPPGL